jgi:hypothetical protein
MREDANQGDWFRPPMFGKDEGREKKARKK